MNISAVTSSSDQGDNSKCNANSSVSGISFSTGAMKIQLKGSNKRKLISSVGIAKLDDGDNEDNEFSKRSEIIRVENSVIRSLHETPAPQSTLLVIPLPPPRNPVTTITEINKEQQQQRQLEANNNDKIRETRTKETYQELTLDEIAARELMNDLRSASESDLNTQSTLSITTSGSTLLLTNKAAAPLLAANLAPELMGLKDEEERFKVDLSLRAEDMDFKSEAYKAVPVEQFGAAMLRGMGWTGPSEEEKKTMEKLIQPREHHLGLGAMPKPPGEERRKGSKEQQRVKEEAWRKKAQEKMSKQLLDVGDKVFLIDPMLAGRRAEVVAVHGVPGLNKIRIAMEVDGELLEVKKTDAILLSEKELLEKPYTGTAQAEEALHNTGSAPHRTREGEEELGDRGSKRMKYDRSNSSSRSRSRSREKKSKSKNKSSKNKSHSSKPDLDQEEEEEERIHKRSKKHLDNDCEVRSRGPEHHRHADGERNRGGHKDDRDKDRDRHRGTEREHERDGNRDRDRDRRRDKSRDRNRDRNHRRSRSRSPVDRDRRDKYRN